MKTVINLIIVGAGATLVLFSIHYQSYSMGVIGLIIGSIRVDL